ncbi:restriction endonuclease subunit S [Bradyrhizobium diazoefficiens]|uniref:restriction endonuclease subunit S n=1 Tax=Bradyrhizobium diazoefficiens TaxID=1355477 RepID=UPI000D7317C2|nr:restriction endonuclease subunit S [Bradyrhizobium diazoefficiens]AWO92413.1 restriction endonuclease subunit S [Bradyrhizobium diazoefficiens]
MAAAAPRKTKTSGIDWLGNIPDDWKVQRLKFITSFAYGDALAAEARTDGEVPVFGSNGIVGTHGIANTVGPTLIIGRKGSFGKVNRSKVSAFAIDTTYFVDKRSTKADIDWLYYLLGSLGLDSFSKDSAVPGLAREDAYEKYCPVPPPAEQRLIASFLEQKTAQLDDLINRKKRLIELVEERRLAIITHAVTRGLDPSVPMTASGSRWFGDIPTHWAVSRVKFVTGFITSGSRGWAEYYSDNGSLFLQSGNIGARMELDFQVEQRVSPPPGAEGKRTVVSIDDVLVCITGARTGAIAHVSKDLGEAYVNQHIALLRPIKSLINPRFLAYSLWSNLGREQLWLSSYGMKEGLGLQHVLSIWIARLPLEEQNAIVAHLDDICGKIDALSAKVESAIEQLQEFRKAVIINAVTGAINVRDRAQEAAE